MKHNRYGSYDDYVREIDDEAERRAHEEEQCEGLPYCVYCLDDRDLEDLVTHINKELDRDEKRADKHHERWEEMRRQRKE